MWKLFLTNLKMTLRNRQALFWSFMFPLMFTVIFGLFFGKNTSVGSVGIINQSDSELASSLVKVVKEAEVFTVTDIGTIDEARDKMQKNSLSAAVYVPENFSKPAPSADNQIRIYYDQGNAQVGTVVVGFVEKFLNQVNFQLAGTQPIFTVVTEKLSDRELTYFDFVLAGVLGLALMNSSIIGIAVGMSKYREDKILKRITTTPIKSWEFITAEVLSRLILNIFQVAVILVIGIYFFDAHIYGSIPMIFVISLVGALLFQLIGFVIASFSKTTDAAQGMATAITIPMMFLAGVFFPIDSLPKWLYSIVQYLPLAPLLRVIRGVTLEAASPFLDPKNLIIVFSWIVVSLIISSFRFRLSDE
jgi:ABC-2 type transport system permease protein